MRKRDAGQADFMQWQQPSLHARAFAIILAVCSVSAAGRVLSSTKRWTKAADVEIPATTLDTIESWDQNTTVDSQGAEDTAEQSTELLDKTTFAAASTTLAEPPAAEPPLASGITAGVPPVALLANIANDNAANDSTGLTASISSSPAAKGSSSLLVEQPVRDPPAVSSSDGLPNNNDDTTASSGAAGSGTASSSSSSSSSRHPSLVSANAVPLPPSIVARVAAIGVPDKCIVAGSALFSSCSLEISKAQAHFNLTVPFLAPQNYSQLLHERGYTRSQVLKYLKEALAKPSKECCAAQCCFNQLLLCDCEPSVLQVAVRFTGADEHFYALMISQLARACGIKYYYGTSCPAHLSVPTSGASCVAGTVWPPVPVQQGANLGPPPAARGTSEHVPTGNNVQPDASNSPPGLVCLASTPQEVVVPVTPESGAVVAAIKSNDVATSNDG